MIKVDNGFKSFWPYHLPIVLLMLLWTCKIDRNVVKHMLHRQQATGYDSDIQVQKSNTLSNKKPPYLDSNIHDERPIYA